MRTTARLAIAASLVACGAFPQAATEFRSHVDLVTIPFTVVDSAGAPVPDLTRDDLRVFDNRVPRIVSYLAQDDDQPITLGILIDESDSQQELLSQHRRAVLDLLNRLLRPTDSAFVISIKEDVRLYRDLTLTQMESFGAPCPKRQRISACGDSPLWNAVYDAARLKLRGVKGNKALLLLTDGFDTGSIHSWREAAAEAQRADTTIYALQSRTGSGRSYAPELYQLVGETGGARFAAAPEGIAAIAARLEADLRRRYVVGFRPEKVTLGKLRHEIRIETTRPNLSVRAWKAYFEEPPPAK